MEAQNAEILHEIENIARAVAGGYPKTAERYQRELQSVKDLEKCRTDSPVYAKLHEYAAEQRQYASTSLDVCVGWRKQLSRLALLVARHLPEFDGTLRHVVFAPEWWERMPIVEWEPLLTELGRIEAAAIRAADAAPRSRVRLENDVVFIDDKPHSLKGSDVVRERLAQFITKLIEAGGDYIQRPADLRTRDIENQDNEIRNMIDSQPGAGTRIKPLFFRRLI